MEELTLTDPIVVPAVTTAKYHVVSILMNLEAVVSPAQEPGYIVIDLKDNNNVRSNYQYTGAPAVSMIKTLNTANLTTKSMHKRILEQLSKDGFLPGTVTGTPDPPTP
jgi:hypothetical protein